MNRPEPATEVPAPPAIEEVGLDELITSARALIAPGQRRILGITGAPGAGKSTLAEAVVTALGHRAALVGLDAFHLANAELHRMGRHARKGAADTFDAAGYINLLRRLRAREDEVVYTAVFDRGLEESIACAAPVPRDTALIVTEGNYLLVGGSEWGPVAPLLDECWYVEPGHGVRLDRLIARHMAFGRTADEAYERSHGSDQRNAELIETTRAKASRVIRVLPMATPPTSIED